VKNPMFAGDPPEDGMGGPSGTPPRFFFFVCCLFFLFFFGFFDFSSNCRGLPSRKRGEVACRPTDGNRFRVVQQAPSLTRNK